MASSTVAGVTIWQARKICRLYFKEYFHSIQQNHEEGTYDVYLHKFIEGEGIEKEKFQDFMELYPGIRFFYIKNSVDE